MYRVELKDVLLCMRISQTKVPNVPCGVERRGRGRRLLFKFFVPNVPCGVENYLMCNLPTQIFPVPNVPCGVENVVLQSIALRTASFLMYRVELKNCFGIGRWGVPTCS